MYWTRPRCLQQKKKRGNFLVRDTTYIHSVSGIHPDPDLEHLLSLSLSSQHPTLWWKAWKEEGGDFYLRRGRAGHTERQFFFFFLRQSPTFLATYHLQLRLFAGVHFLHISNSLCAGLWTEFPFLFFIFSPGQKDQPASLVPYKMCMQESRIQPPSLPSIHPLPPPLLL